MSAPAPEPGWRFVLKRYRIVEDRAVIAVSGPVSEDEARKIAIKDARMPQVWTEFGTVVASVPQEARCIARPVAVKEPAS